MFNSQVLVASVNTVAYTITPMTIAPSLPSPIHPVSSFNEFSGLFKEIKIYNSAITTGRKFMDFTSPSNN